MDLKQWLENIKKQKQKTNPIRSTSLSSLDLNSKYIMLHSENYFLEIKTPKYHPNYAQ